MPPLRVCLDARLIEGRAGGVEQMVIGLASGLSGLDDGDERYLFLAFDEHDWLAPHLKGSCSILPQGESGRGSFWANPTKRSSILRSTWHRVGASRRLIRVPRSDRTVERAGVSLMHFTAQMGFTTEIPSIYHPHDLQHIHFPRYFTRRDRVVREVTYRTLCKQADIVAVTASWGKDDLIRQYALPREKVKVVPLAPFTQSYEKPSADEVNAFKRRLDLPDRFVFYPAQTWPHKNHINLVAALALLRKQRGLIVPLVCSGQLTEFFAEIDHRTRALDFADYVRFLGFVSPAEMQCLYQLCDAVVIPTKFEAASGPLWEAFLAGKPAACSKVTSLPRQAGDAALLFDQDRPEEIAEAVHRLWMDAELRQALIHRGYRRVSHFTWERTARHFRAHYRRIAHQSLTAEDRRLLAAPPLL